MKHMRRWGAVYILVGLWIISSLLFGWFEYRVQVNEAVEHGETFDRGAYGASYWSAYFENLQSEWAQLATQAVLVVALADRLFKAGQKDVDEIKMQLDRLDDRTRYLQPGLDD